MILSLPQEAARGAADTARLMQLRWEGMRSRRGKVAIAAAVLLICVSVISAANMGLAVKFMAMQGFDSAAGIFARSWILSLERNEIGDIGAITLGGALIAAVFAPFTGSATVSIVPVEDLNTVRPARLHRYFDSLLINAFSGIGLLQLLTLTGIASVLTVEGNHSVALVVTWLIWGSVIILTTTVGWALEWGTRKIGALARLASAAAILAVVAALAVRDPLEIRRLFGLGSLYAEWMKNASLNGSFLGPAAGIAAVTAVILLSGLFAARAALNLPVPARSAGKEYRPTRQPPNLTIATLTTLVTSIYRTTEVRRPLIAVVALGVPAMLFVEVTANIQNAILMAVPLAVALAWGVNLFGVFGQSMNWLLTQPRIPDMMVKQAFWIQSGTITVLILMLTAIAALSGNATPQIAYSLICGGVAASILASAASLTLSVRRPIRARLGGRGDALVPPVTALGYLVLILIVACAPAIVIATGIPMWAQAPAAVLAAVTGIAVQKNTQKEWRKPARRAKTASVVSAN